MTLERPVPQAAIHRFVVRHEHLANFDEESVHPVLSTFAITKEAEWAGRLVLKPIRLAGEEGIGTFVEIYHRGPAFEGEEITIEAEPMSVEQDELIVSIRVTVGERLIAEGKTGQKLLPMTVINSIFNKARSKRITC